jgi:hypothetical protein
MPSLRTRLAYEVTRFKALSDALEKALDEMDDPPPPPEEEEPQ